MMASGLSVALAVFDQLSHAVSPVIINESNPVARTGAQNPSSDGCITLTLIPKPSPRRDVPLSPLNRETLYGGAEQGYTDYPGLRTVVTHA